MEQQPTVNTNKVRFWQSNTARIAMVGILTLILLIPLSIVRELITERAYREKDVINEINDKWGGDVYFYGPILKVPYISYTESRLIDEKTKAVILEKTKEIKYAYFFPEELINTSDVETKPLKRNNYQSVVFTTKMNFKGKYIQPDFSTKNIHAQDILWKNATILIETSNLKSIKDEVKIKLADKEYIFEPIYNSNSGTTIEALETLFIDFENLLNKEAVSFDFNIKYDGSKQLSLVPIGKTTKARITSNWHSPSFNGNFLPNDKTKKITDNGFEADWKILHINRAFTQSSFERLPNLQQYAFGVDFVIPVDEYQKNERASKYGFLIIGLTFLIFFLIQSISKIKIHIFQYTMIGLALIMFYTLLISITEHSSFLKAYIISGVAVVVLISVYSVSILKNKKFPAFIGLALTALYTFIFLIIQMENYALLGGSIGLFIILALVMYFSRKIDWNSN